MSNKLTLWVKNLGLSKEEVVMRKQGIKNEHGEFTVQAKEIIINTLCKEREAELLKIATELEAEEKEERKACKELE